MSERGSGLAPPGIPVWQIPNWLPAFLPGEYHCAGPSAGGFSLDFIVDDGPCDNLPQVPAGLHFWRRTMAELPRGTVTFLFTDIEGNTALWEQATMSTVLPPILKSP
jgi:hypothetical protein